MNPLQQVVENTLLQAAKQVEEQLDSQLHRLDNLDEDDLEKLRRQRLEEMKRQVMWQ
jgi:acetyl-CoA carboxylase alpha subunit